MSSVSESDIDDNVTEFNDEIECWNCESPLLIIDAVSDPIGHPLCKECFNILVSVKLPVREKREGK